MPDYKVRGVFIEEAGLRATAIEGVDTGAAGFAGLSARGPDDSAMPLLGSFADFEEHYGGLESMVLDGKPMIPYLAYAARAFFANGGRRLYVARVSRRPASRLGASKMSRASTPLLDDWKRALGLLRQNPDIAILAAPGAGALGGTMAAEVNALLVADAEASRAYRFAVLDTPPGLGMAEVLAFRQGLDSSRAAIHYPWITIANPLAEADSSQEKTVDLPPSGFICGIYVRTDSQRGVFKSPANEVVIGAIGLQRAINKAQQDVLNPLGINCIREFAGRGIRVWGARTLSSDPEWKYVNLRRYFIYLEHSIDHGTQWAVFEPNGEALWAKVRNAIDEFLLGQWKNGALLGSKPEEAFFVKCDRSTMTQNDLDNGRLVCLVGVAALKPAEFVIVRIGQRTGDYRA